MKLDHTNIKKKLLLGPPSFLGAGFQKKSYFGLLYPLPVTTILATSQKLYNCQVLNPQGFELYHLIVPGYALQVETFHHLEGPAPVNEGGPIVTFLFLS